MASGTIELTRNPEGVYLIGRILWSSESNGTEKNTSTVTATLQLQRDAANTTTGTFKGTFTVGSVSETISWYGALPSRTWVTIKTITATVNHNPDGTGSCCLQAKINGPGLTTMEGTYVSGSSTVALDTIPRYALLTAAPDFHDEENPVISYHSPAGNSVSTLEACISLDGSQDTIAYRSIPKTGTSYTFSLTEAERNVLRGAVTTGRSRTVLFCLRTTIGTSTGYASLSKTFTIQNPEPVIRPAITDSNDETFALTGDRSKLIRYFSNASVTIGASAVKQAALTGTKVTCGSKSLSGDGTIQGAESGSFVFFATDSRGTTTQKTVMVPFVEYIRLTCSLGNHIPDAAGNLTVKADGNWFNGSFGAKSNTLKVYYRYKSYGGDYCDWTEMSLQKSGNTYTATAGVTGLDYRTAYVVQTYAADALVKAYSAERTVKATPVFDWGKEDFSFHVPVSLEAGAEAVRLTTSHDLNTIKKSGWYQWYSGEKPANAPVGPNATYMTAMRVHNSGNTCSQEIVDTTDSVDHGCRVCRTIYGSKVYPWEWENPPMTPGYEYRTTGRWRGKPVYVKLVDCGGLPNAATKTVTYNDSGVVDEPIGCDGVCANEALSANASLDVTVTKTTVILTTAGNLSGHSAQIAVKYTKIAD